MKLMRKRNTCPAPKNKSFVTILFCKQGSRRGRAQVKPTNQVRELVLEAANQRRAKVRRHLILELAWPKTRLGFEV